MKVLRQFWLLALAMPKSIIFNLRYFTVSDAIHLPVIISHRVVLKKLSGQVILGHVEFGVVRIGFNDIGIFDKARSRSIWEVTGTVCFRGNAKLGHGSKISVAGELVIGKDFVITAESSIVANKKVDIGDHVLVSWDVLIMDTDFHSIKEKNGGQINPDKAVLIGNNVWIGCRCTVLKGVKILDGNVIGAGSLIAKSILESNSVIAGNPPICLRKEITWSSQ